MKLLTRIFGEAEIDENKIITFPKGIIGFPDLTRFALMYDTDKRVICKISSRSSWSQDSRC